MSYQALKTLHLIAVVLLVGAMLTVAAARPSLAGDAAALRRLRRLNAWVATPALIAVWGLGLVLAVEGGWFAAGWLHAKLALVVALSGLHGWQSGALRRGRPAPLWPAIAVIALATAIAVLAGFKP